MKDIPLILWPRDELLARDSRPYGNFPGAYARTLPFPLPQTVAGAVRTAVGRDLNWDWGTDGPALARQITVWGPLLYACPRGGNWEVHLPQPLDALVVGSSAQDVEDKLFSLRPMTPAELPPGAGTNLPAGMWPLRVPTREKARDPARFWPLSAVWAWLAGRNPGKVRAIAGLVRHVRTHVRMDDHGTAQEHGLFHSESLVFPDKATKNRPAQALLLRARVPEAWTPDPFVTLGGERGLAYLGSAPGTWPQVPQQLKAAVAGARRVRLYLATPGLFADGWKPGWLDTQLVGTPPGAGGVRLRLVAAAVGRKVWVSGWDMEKDQPKPMRAAVPAGSVYFFEVLDGDPTDLLRTSLESVADDPADRSQGYGLALWGTGSAEEGGL